MLDFDSMLTARDRRWLKEIEETFSPGAAKRAAERDAQLLRLYNGYHDMIRQRDAWYSKWTLTFGGLLLSVLANLSLIGWLIWRH